jgi:nucleoside-diphosphate-sugar epimerase
VNILITGGAGYIGTKLISHLSDAHNIVVFDNLYYDQDNIQYKNNSIASISELFSRKRVKFYKEDITQFSRCLEDELQEADVIIPLAALVGAPLCDKNKEEAIKLNQTFIEQLVDSVRSDQLIIYPNSNSGYGSVEGICTEETPTNPLSLYGETKQNAEDYLLANHKNSIVFRLATVFGISSRTRVDLLVNDMVRRSMNGPIELFDGHYRRNYVHVSDVARAFIFAIENKDKMIGGVFNVGADNLNMTKKELVSTICEVSSGSFSEIDSKTDPDKRDYMVSSKKIIDLGFDPLYNSVFKLREVIIDLMYFYYHVAPEDLTQLRNY